MKKHTALVTLVVLVGIAFSLVAAGTYAPTLSNNSQEVKFTCWLATDFEFDVSVKIDLSDGMNSSEAVLVARSIFEHKLTNATYNVESEESDGEGIWTVFLSWDYSPRESLGHYFNVKIDPKNLTVTYERCY